METNYKSAGLLRQLATIVDITQQTHRGKATIIFEVDKTEFEEVKRDLDVNEKQEDRFKIEISGIEIIYLLKNV